jgi:hypothetical protein
MTKDLHIYRVVFNWFAIAFSTLILAAPLHTFAQEIPATVVRTSGASDATSENNFNQRLEQILAALNAWHDDKKDAFPAGPGISNLKTLVNKLGLRSIYDTVRVQLLQIGPQQFETRGLHIMQEGGAYPGWQELVLTLDKNAAVLGARMADEAYSMDKYLASDRRIVVEDQQRAEEALNLFQALFSNKDSKGLAAMIAKDASIVSATRNKTTGRLEYVRMDSDAFLKRTRERTFASRDDIDFSLTDAKFIAHKDLDGVVGVIAKQTLVTSRFTDVGYVFLAIDVDQSPPKILIRHWQEDPITRVPVPTEARAQKRQLFWYTKDVRSVDAAEFRGLSEGRLKIILKSKTSLEGFNAGNMRGWLNTGQLRFDRIQIIDGGTGIRGNDTLLVMYTFTPSEPTQEFLLGIDFRETGSIAGYSGKVRVFPGRETEVVVQLLQPGETEPKVPVLNADGNLLLVTNVRQPNVMVMTPDGILLRSVSGDETNMLSMTLLEGNYRIEISRYNYEPVIKDITISRGTTERLEVLLPRIPVVPRTTKKKNETKPIRTGAVEKSPQAKHLIKRFRRESLTSPNRVGKTRKTPKMRRLTALFTKIVLCIGLQVGL